MYLALLSEREKDMFLGVAFNLAVADGDYSDGEKAVVNGYCQEMQCVFDESTMVKPLDVLIKDIKLNSDKRIQRIFIFELMGLVMADGKYNEVERALINKLETEFDVVQGFVENCETALNEYIAFQTKLNQLILK